MFRSFCRPGLDECPRVEAWFTGLRVVMKRGRAPVSPESFANSGKGSGQGRLPFPISRPVSTESRSLWPWPAFSGLYTGPARANRKEPRLMLSVPLWLISTGIWGVLAEGGGSSLSSCRQHNVIIGTTTVQLHGTVSLHIQHR